MNPATQTRVFPRLIQRAEYQVSYFLMSSILERQRQKLHDRAEVSVQEK